MVLNDLIVGALDLDGAGITDITKRDRCFCVVVQPGAVFVWSVQPRSKEMIRCFVVRSRVSAVWWNDLASWNSVSTRTRSA